MNQDQSRPSGRGLFHAGTARPTRRRLKVGAICLLACLEPVPQWRCNPLILPP